MKAYRLTEGATSWFVRGTEEPQVALDLVLEEFPEAYDDLDMPEDRDIEVFPVVERTGLFRFSPCWCGEHGWHLDYATKPGRGVFKGVLLDVGAREVFYESDLDKFLAEA